jgi:hypothetical protein
MTTQQLYWFNSVYLVVLVAVTVLTRATARRAAGALAGGAVSGLVVLGLVAIWEHMGLWHMTITWAPYFLILVWIGLAEMAFVFLLTWRIARRFGPRGLVAVVVILAVIGPPRDYWYMRHFPEWGAYAPGVAPLVAVSVSYVLLWIVGHGVMRLVAGPATQDRLARWPWESAE